MSKNKHNRIIDDLETRLKDSTTKYDWIMREKEYGPKRAPIGELDLVAVHGKSALVFEVKSTYSDKSRRKAYIQLQRAIKQCHLLRNYTVYGFYSYGTKLGKTINDCLFYKGK